MERLKSRWIGLLLLLLIIALAGANVMAQDTVATTPVVIGDSDAESLQVVQSYLETRDPNLLAQDIHYFEPSIRGPNASRDTIAQTESLFYDQAFTDIALVPLRDIVADEGFVIVEMEFAGHNTGTYFGQPATDVAVLVPMIGVYRVETGQVVYANLYYDTNDLYSQLGYGWYGPVGGDPRLMMDPQGNLPTWVGDILDDPSVYYGEHVIIDGNVGRAMDSDSFILYENQFLAPNYEVLVFTQTEEARDFIQVPDSRVRVEGTVYPYNAQDLSTQLNRELDPLVFADYESAVVIIADRITNVEVVQTIGHIVDNPEAFYGQEVTVNGLVGDPVSQEAFTFYQDQLIGIRGQVLVINHSGQAMNFAAMNNEHMRIRGTVYSGMADAQAIADRTGLNIADPAYADYREMTVIIAEEIAPVQSW